MEKKFTSGPWRECGHERGGCVCGQVWSLPMDFEVAECHLINEENGTEITREQLKANALLIAHAPEMFDVLESLEIGFRKRGAVDIEMLRIADGIKEILTKATAIN